MTKYIRRAAPIKLLPWHLRPMTAADVEAVIQVERSAYRYPWELGTLCDCLHVGYCCWVCELEGSLIGHGVMSVAAGECHILNVCVQPRWQGAGLGREILSHLLGLARQHQADTAFLEVRVSNTPAIHLYQAAGFNEIGRRQGYYPHTQGREDALVFAKHLGLSCGDS